MSNVPKLRFKEFSGKNDDLKEYTFEDIFSFSTGKNIKQNEASPDFDIPCVRYGELYHMYGEVISTVYNKTNLAKSELLFSNGNEILMPSAGEDPLDIGSASALTIKNVAIGRTINIMRPLKENVYSQKYVSYFINEKLRKKISTLAKGSSISNVYNSDLKKLKITLPRLEEQEKIASFLTSVDTKIQLLTKKEELLSSYKKGVMQKIFSQEIRFKADDGSVFPEWEEKQVSSFMIERNIKTPKSDAYPLMAFVAHKGVTHKGDRYNREFLVNDGDAKKYKQTEYGDFIYSSNNLETGSIGLNTYGSATISPVYSIFQITDSCNYEFISRLLVTKSFIYKMVRFRQGVVYGQWKIHESDFLKIKVNIPCLEEQIKIANFLSSIDSKIDQVKEQLVSTKEFKKALLQQMFV